MTSDTDTTDLLGCFEQVDVQRRTRRIVTLFKTLVENLCRELFLIFWDQAAVIQETKKAISKANSGSGNGMFGRKMSEEEKAIKSKFMKDKILNGEFTPKSTNRLSHRNMSFKPNITWKKMGKNRGGGA